MSKRRNPYGVSSRRRGFSPLALIGLAVTLIIALVIGTVMFVLPHIGTKAAEANADCSLIVPPHPLTAQGLATPYQLVATDPANGPCTQTNPDQQAFVQGTVIDFDTGKISVYNPLVIDKGTRPAITPTPPRISQRAVVALWFGFNGDNLTLQGTRNSLQDGRCVNGAKGSIFGQYAYCNAPLFFGVANQAVNLGTMEVPPLGTAKDGKPCPTVRDFSIVDQDQSDNVTTTYLMTKNGQFAQSTAANQKRLANAQQISNGSDNALLDVFVDPAIGCTPWEAPDLANPGHNVPALALNELQAMVYQQDPIALIPLNNPMSLNGDNFSMEKTNLYRAGVDQPRATDASKADPKAYCQNMVDIGITRMVADAPMTVKAATPDDGTGNNLFTFLAQRFVNSYGELKCQDLLGVPSTLATVQNADGVATAVTLNGQPVDVGDGGTGQNPGTQAPDCIVNKQTVKGCAGTVQVNGQSCKVSFANNTVVMDCRKK